MARRVYVESVKLWAIKLGIPLGSIGTMIGLVFFYLSMSGAITITGHSGDSVCAGTLEDPCIAYINLTANEDIFLYPFENADPWGRNTIMEFAPGVKDWKLQRSWGKGWRDIPLNETCTGTWCGAPNNKGVKYSYVLREGRDYKFRIIAYKNSPYDTIKWAVNYDDREYLDPVWDNEMTGKSVKEKLQDKDYQKYLRESNSVVEKNGKIKTYNSLEKRLKIEDKNNVLIDMKLTSSYKNLVGTGRDIKVAEFLLVDYQGQNLFDSLDFYNIKKEHTKEIKQFKLKYAVEIIEKKCHNLTNNDTSVEYICNDVLKTNWIEFDLLSELPDKNIRIGIFADTTLGEYIEWVPTIQGFESLEWASYLVTDLVSYWKLDDSAIDSHGSNNGTASGGSYSSGIINNGYRIDTDNSDKVITSINIQTEHSLSFWIYIDNFGNANNGAIASDSNEYYQIFASYEVGGDQTNRDLVFVMKNQAGVNKVLNTDDDRPLSVDTWYHLVFTCNSTAYCKVYINSTVVVEGDLDNLHSSSTGLQIGDGPQHETTCGTYDEIAYWTRELSQSDVTELYNSGDGFAYPFENPFIALNSPIDNYYNLNLGNIDFKCDVSSNVSITNVTFYSNYSGSFIVNGTNSSGVSGEYIFSRNIQNYNDFIWNCYACDNESKCDFALNNYSIDMVNLTLQITNPTTSNPKTVSTGDNISINFNFQEDGVNLTSGVTFGSVFIGGSEATICSSEDAGVGDLYYDSFEANFTSPWYDDGIAEKWTRDLDGTPSSGTGPQPQDSAPGALGTDYYIFVETSSAECYTSGETAIAYQTPEINWNSQTGEQISWYNYAYGANIGNLTLQENSTGSWVVLWTEVGTNIQSWRQNTTDLSSLTGSGNLRFYYTCGGGWTGDLAIDEINISSVSSVSDEFAYISGVGWQVNVTVPDFASGLKDLFVNATYSGNTENDTQTNAINYAAVDTCSCPGSGNNWEVNMEDYCNLTTACNLGTGNLSWIGSSGYFNCSSQLNLTNRNAPPSATTFYFSSGCEVIHLIFMLLVLNLSKLKYINIYK